MATATAYVSSSLFNRINNLSFTHSSISLTTTNFPQRPISHKPFNLTLKPQSFNLSSLPLQSLHPPFVATDEFETSQDTIISQQEEPEPETSDKPKQDEEQTVTTSDDARRLYVGNLPFSMTSSQLAEIFAEAGTVVSVEVFILFFLHNFLVLFFIFNISISVFNWEIKKNKIKVDFMAIEYLFMCVLFD